MSETLEMLQQIREAVERAPEWSEIKAKLDALEEALRIERTIPRERWIYDYYGTTAQKGLSGSHFYSRGPENYRGIPGKWCKFVEVIE